MNGGIFDEISSFIAYAQSIYLTCMHNYARACMYEYLVRLEVFIFVSESLSTAFLRCVSSEWPGETVYLPRLL